LWTEDTAYPTHIACQRSSTSPYRSFYEVRGTPEDAMRIVKFCEQKLKEIKKKEVKHART